MLQIPEIEFGDVVLQPIYRRVRLQGDVVTLTEQESYLLEALALCEGTMVTRRMLGAVLQMQYRRAIKSNTVDAHISRLRRKLHASKRIRIYSVRKHGYKLVAE